jgi:membrane protein implicated in regulation of membrane protease activity
VSVFLFIQLPSLFLFFFLFSPVSAACFPLFSKKFLLLCPLPVFILFFAVYSLAVAVLSVVLVVVAGGHGGERQREEQLLGTRTKDDCFLTLGSLDPPSLEDEDKIYL